MTMWQEGVAAATAVAMAGLVLVAVLAPGPALGATNEIQDCESSDMLVLLAPSGEGHWESPEVYLAPWRFAHRVDVFCDAASCKVAGGLFAVRGSPSREPTTTLAESAGVARIDKEAAALRVSKNTLRDDWTLRGDIAREMAMSISAKAFLGSDGRNHYVWINNGRLQTSISIRGRTEIVCGLDGDLCSVMTTVFVFIPYDEVSRCGYISEAAEDTGKSGGLQLPSNGRAADLRLGGLEARRT